MYIVSKFITNIFFIIAIGALLLIDTFAKKDPTFIYFLKMFIGGCSIVIAGFWAVYYFQKILNV